MHNFETHDNLEAKDGQAEAGAQRVQVLVHGSKLTQKALAVRKGLHALPRII